MPCRLGRPLHRGVERRGDASDAPEVATVMAEDAAFVAGLSPVVGKADAPTVDLRRGCLARNVCAAPAIDWRSAPAAS
jgi:hypothetical protein